ncbi:MAG: helix-turn-helix transcriptional regulator [Lachnospiraceae bacterium]|nr:helix-turn-helix transcriptional regulator [Lachnospiraceae bacterium]
MVIVIKDRLKLLRKKLGLTQQVFADRIGIARGNVAAYEVGKNAPSDAVISLICREFNANEIWLRTGEGEMFVEMDLEDELMQWAGTVLASEPDSFKKRFVRMLSKLSEDEWDLLAKMATELVNDTEKAADE